MTGKLQSFSQNRRRFLQHSFMGLGAFVGNSLLLPSIANSSPLTLDSIGDLQAPDKNGVRLPKGFSSRIVARSGHDYFGYDWHSAPDGGATFANYDDGRTSGEPSGSMSVTYTSESSPIATMMIPQMTSRTKKRGCATPAIRGISITISPRATRSSVVFETSWTTKGCGPVASVT